MASHARHVTADEFDSVVLGADKPVLVDFWADWCPPCHAIAPTIDSLAGAFAKEALVAKVDVEEAPAVAQRYGVDSIPTLVFFRGGAEVGRLVGAVSRTALEKGLRAAIDGAGAPRPKA